MVRAFNISQDINLIHLQPSAGLHQHPRKKRPVARLEYAHSANSVIPRQNKSQDADLPPDLFKKLYKSIFNKLHGCK